MITCNASFHTEIIEALSSSTGTPIVTTINTAQPSVKISGAKSNITIMPRSETLPLSNVTVTDVPIVTEAMCTQPTAGDEGMHTIICSVEI